MWPFPDLTLQVLSEYQRVLQFDLDDQFCVIGILGRWGGPEHTVACVFNGNRMSLGEIVYDVDARWFVNARIAVRSVKVIPGIQVDPVLHDAVLELRESPSGPKKLRSVLDRRIYDYPTFWCRIPGQLFGREAVDRNHSLNLSCDTVAALIEGYFPQSAIAKILTFLVDDKFLESSEPCDFWRRRGLSLRDAIDIGAWGEAIDESISMDLEKSGWLEGSLFSEIERQELENNGKFLSKLHYQRLLLDLLESLPMRRKQNHEDGVAVEVVEPVTHTDKSVSVFQFEERLISDTERQLQRNRQSARPLWSKSMGMPLRDLATQLGKGASGFGLEAILIRDACQEGCLRAVLIDLLAKRIRAWFPSGYHADAGISPAAAAASWQSVIEKRIDDERILECTRNVVDYFREHLPPDGWYPLDGEDLFVAAAFERCWLSDSGDEL